MKLYITSFNLLTPLKAICEQGVRLGLDPVIVDNASTYPPLVDWLMNDCPHRVARLTENKGQRAAWDNGTIDTRDKWWAVTDCDLDLSGVPSDTVHVLMDGMRRHDWAVKAGLSLELEDIPEDLPLTKRVRNHERRFWEHQLDDQFFQADIDTTFAVYRKDGPQGHYGPAIRANRPYTARHLPWYWDPANLDKEQKQYLEKCSSGGRTWTPQILEIAK